MSEDCDMGGLFGGIASAVGSVAGGLFGLAGSNNSSANEAGLIVKITRRKRNLRRMASGGR